MIKHAHLTTNDRSIIQQRLAERESFKSIGRELGKDPTTISKEVKHRIQFKQTGCYGKAFNNCYNRRDCTAQHLCGNKRCTRQCRFCQTHTCSALCPAFQIEVCPKLSKAPYVCNGCRDRIRCTLEKRIYNASRAQEEYEHTLSEARQGIQLTEQEALRLDDIISPLLKKGQSLHHICVRNADKIMQHERTLYHYVDAGLFTARNIDMPRVVRMGKRKKKKDHFKVDKKCRTNRTYADFQQYLSENPSTPIVEMDSVEGIKGGKVLLTLHFVVPQLMLAFIRDANTSQSVIDIFNKLYHTLQPEIFRSLFQVVLGDNGSEFSNPVAIETDSKGIRRTRVFYCDPNAPYQKGAAENNHSVLRRIIPKGTSFDGFTQKHIDLMMNHVNSYGRPNLGNKTPYEVFDAIYGGEIIKKLGAELIHPNQVTLHPSLLKK